MADKIYTLYVKSTCPFCVKAQEELIKRKETHTLFIMDEKPEELEKLQALWNHTTVPLITAQHGDVEVFIGVYTDLLEWFKVQETVEL